MAIEENERYEYVGSTHCIVFYKKYKGYLTMKTIASILVIIVHSLVIAQSNKLQDTVYLKDREAWDFYTSYKCMIIYGYKENYNILKSHDSKYKEAINLIDDILKTNTNSESIRKPLLRIGVKEEFIPRYKLIFNQLMSGLFPSFTSETDYDSRIPDNVMYVIDRKTNLIKYIKCTDFILKFPNQPTDHNIDFQIVADDVLQLVQLNMKRFRKNGYKGR